MDELDVQQSQEAGCRLSRVADEALPYTAASFLKSLLGRCVQVLASEAEPCRLGDTVSIL